jgi:S1-C subfamily serine protease
MAPFDLEANMKKMLTTSATAVFALALVVPAFAGGAYCRGHASSATADAQAACEGHTMSAWSGAWLQRSEDGQVTVAEVAKGSPAARSGLKAGDIVLAVNGYDCSDTEHRAMCASKADCSVGSSGTYKVQRGHSKKSIRFKLEKRPADATMRFANRQATYDRALAALVMPTVN